MQATHMIVTRIEARDGKVVDELARTPANILQIGDAIPGHLEAVKRRLGGDDAAEADEAKPQGVTSKAPTSEPKTTTGGAAPRAPTTPDQPMGPVEIALAWAKGKPAGTTATCDEMVDWARVNLGVSSTAMSLGNSIPKNPRLKLVFEKVPHTHPARWKIVQEVVA